MERITLSDGRSGLISKIPATDGSVSVVGYGFGLPHKGDHAQVVLFINPTDDVAERIQATLDSDPVYVAALKKFRETDPYHNGTLGSRKSV